MLLEKDSESTRSFIRLRKCDGLQEHVWFRAFRGPVTFEIIAALALNNGLKIRETAKIQIVDSWFMSWDIFAP